MSISSRISAMQEHLQDDYSVLELAGADLTNIDKNIQNLKPTWKERLLHFINNGTDVVWENWDKVTGEGTSLTLNNTLEAKMKIELKGNTYQEGTPTPTSPQDIHVVSGDNSIEVVGKNLISISPNYEITGGPVVIDLERPVKAGTYIISIDSFITTGTTSGLIHFLDSNNTQIAFAFLDNTTKTKNITVDNSIAKIRLYSQNSASASTGITSTYKNMMLSVNGGTYEPYQSNSYDIDLGIQNLFDTGSITLGYRIGADGGNYLDNNYYASSFMKVEPNTQYIKNSPSQDAYHRIAFYSSNNVSNWISSSNDNVITTPATCNYIRICGLETEVPLTKVGKGNNIDKIVDNAIELCSISTYKDRIFKSSGKNLFDYQDLASKIQTFTTSGTANNFTLVGYGTYQYPISISTNEIISGSWSTTNLNGDVKAIYEDDTNENIFSSYTSSSTSGTISFIPTKKVKAIQFITFNSNNNITINNLMINEGTTAIPYEPYGTDWYLKKEIGKLILNGQWVSSTNYTGLFTINNTASGINYISGGYSDHFKYENNNLIIDNGTANSNLTNNQMAFRLGTTKDRLYIKTDIASSNTELQTWFRNNNTTVYYVLATPTYTKIEGTLKDQLETLKLSYDSQTNVSQTNTDLSFELDVKALQKM